MYERTTEQKNNYFRELALNLQREGFEVNTVGDDLLPVELENKQLCQATHSGGVRYWREDITDERMSKALERVTDIAKITDEYISRLDAVPFLKVGSQEGRYHLLADFNGTILAGCQTEYGAQFVTWERGPDRTSLNHGHYFGPNCGAGGYVAAKQDFAIRSGLVDQDQIFSAEQLTEIYRSIHETLELEYRYPITDSRRKILESACEQIEDAVADLNERVGQSNQAELELANAHPDQGMTFLN